MKKKLGCRESKIVYACRIGQSSHSTISRPVSMTQKTKTTTSRDEKDSKSTEMRQAVSAHCAETGKRYASTAVSRDGLIYIYIYIV